MNAVIEWMQKNPTATIGLLAILNNWFLFWLGRKSRSAQLETASSKDNAAAKEADMIIHKTRVFLRTFLAIVFLWLLFLLMYIWVLVWFAAESTPPSRIGVISVSLVVALGYYHLTKLRQIVVYCRLARIAWSLARRLSKNAV